MGESPDDTIQTKSHAQRNAEYFSSLEKWLDEVRLLLTCNFMSGFPFGVLPNMPPQGVPGMTTPPMPFVFPPMPNFTRNLPQFQANQPDELLVFGAFTLPALCIARQFIFYYECFFIKKRKVTEYTIPPLWKRFFAEFIDFFILFFIKFSITLIAVDFFDFIDLNKFDLAMLQKNEKVDYQWALEMTSEILMLEFIHRLLVCAYEGCTIAQQSGFQRGGSTPGKGVMGLRVVCCRVVLPGPTQSTVRVSPASTLSFRQSIARACLKNLILAFLFPICFPLFFNKHNRTGYDIICKCIVVEDANPHNARLRR